MSQARNWTAVLSVFAGALAGIGGAAVYGFASRDAEPPPGRLLLEPTDVKPPRPAVARASGAGPAAGERLRIAELESRISDLEAARGGETPAATGATGDADLELEKRLERAEVEARAIHDRMLGRFGNEGPDPAWSAATRETFGRDLQKVSATGKFTVVDLSCRTTLCVATLEWPSREQAELGFASVLETEYQMKHCDKEIFLDPRRTEKPYRAQAIFDCERQRATRD